MKMESVIVIMKVMIRTNVQLRTLLLICQIAVVVQMETMQIKIQMETAIVLLMETIINLLKNISISKQKFMPIKKQRKQKHKTNWMIKMLRKYKKS